ncbi:ATP-binding protein [Lactobacillus sp. PV037]|uniref:ATP-binding protein n=1 Tax=Lactobacillus sp. PV037 TaxID=2594496 RepID=UPI0022403488|nr:ATP-binding protein [Lactobacillus sp. PV037]QNQ84338.1 ATP-binding protein [Lactobacillus sp. PV037]
MHNPFNPSFGKIPPVLLGRKEIQEDYLEELDNPNTPYQTAIVYGMRGVGKTTFLTEVSQKLSKKEDWLVVDLAMGNNLLENLIDDLYRKSTNKIKKILDTLKGISFSAVGLQISASLGKPTVSTYQGILQSILMTLTNQGIHVLITIDEVKATKELRSFVAFYQLLIRKNLFVNLLMTGLPENVSELQNEDVLTFLLRSPRIGLSALSLFEINLAYKKVFSQSRIELSDEVAEMMTKMTKGYSYAFQLLGYLAWKKGKKIGEVTADVLSDLLPTYIAELEKNSYTKIYQEFSEKDQEFLQAMAMMDENVISVTEIRNKLGKSSGYISMYRRRLLDAQVIETRGYGKITFTLPYFKEFVNEMEKFKW